MTPSAKRREDAAARATSELAQLREQVRLAREELSRLRRDMDQVVTDDGGRADQLLEANERLTVAAVRAHAEVESTTSALNEASRTAGLDALTQLPNRVLMLDRLTHAIASAGRHATRMALLFVDLDNFKEINDSHGHAFGDHMLRLAAQSLVESVRGEDTVSRHGGDEFLILLAEVSHPSDAVAVADKVVAALSALSEVGAQALHLTATIGISIFPDDGEDPASLIERADVAMYQAKRDASRGVVLYGAVPPEERRPASPGVAAASRPARRPVRQGELAYAAHERRHAQLREANEQLVLAAITAQEKQATAELALKRQTEFLALAAHELRSPLGPIRHASTLLGMSRADTKVLNRAMAIIDGQVARIERLVGDLLDVSRFKSGMLNVERRHVDLRALIDAAVDSWRPAIDARRQHLTVRCPSRELGVYGDPARIAQVLDNVLDNASRYTPDHGSIDLSVEVVDHAAVVTFADNGIGIAAESLPRVFELFGRQPPPPTDTAAGLGIGLAVVRELVEAHDGNVRVTSDGRGHGTQVVVTLPLTDSAREVGLGIVTGVAKTRQKDSPNP